MTITLTQRHHINILAYLHVLSVSAGVTEVVALAALIYLSWWSHLILTKGTQQLPKDEMLQTR